MSILSDKEIAIRSYIPDAALENAAGLRRSLVKVKDWDLESFISLKDGIVHDGLTLHTPTQEELDSFRKPMIYPFSDKLVSKEGDRRVISWGLSSYGYDARLSDEFKIFSNVNSAIIDPKNFSNDCLVDGRLIEDEHGKYVILPPNSYLLGRTIEYFHIPRDILSIVLGKSTYARTASIVNVTPIEPGFEGHVVIEISNASPSPLKIYANEGIAQFVFLKGDVPCSVSYDDRKGKYQGQTGIQIAKV